MKILYVELGDRLTRLRTEAGMQQSDLAAAANVSQQTVSRWERGVSRPSLKQLQILSIILKASNDELLVLAGRTPGLEVVISHAQPFPIWALTPEVFETFICYFLDALYPSASVHPVGARGHTQDGTDVDVAFSDSVNFSFQCKRHKVFGPDKVAKAVLAHTWPAAKKFIVLTRPASPQARLEIKKYEDWDMWDVEDISRKVRSLSKDSQRRLVDIFFRGQRLALLGEPEPGPWQTTEEFFAAFNGRGAFSHDWQLVGRAEEIGVLSENLENSAVRVLFLVGPGGAGKSRILKQVIENYEDANAGILVRFVSPTEEIKNKDLDDLGDREKLIVIEDAHDDRNDLQLLLQYAAVSTHKAKLLFSFRPYGLDFIKAQASNFGLIGERLHLTRLMPLTLDQTEKLATQVLQAYEGPLEAAKDIAKLTLDCPLATVIGAQIVAKEKKSPDLIKNEDIFRSTLLGKFQDIIAGEIGNKSETESIKKLLKVLALVQPFYLEDESIPKIVSQVEGLSIPEINKLIRLLSEAGILFKRGGKHRLSPDLLADYIIEQACIGVGEKSTGYAEQVFDVADNTYVQNLLVNLGKLDWRRANGDPSNSRLLDGVWSRLKPTSDYSDPHLKAVVAVAFYQPERALVFAEHLIENGKYLRDLPNLIKYAGYSLKHLHRACECLWELGKKDIRALHQTPEHAVRILAELCAVEPNKPIEYSSVVAEYGLSLLDKDSWSYSHTPLDILKGILQTEGHATTSDYRTMVMSPFTVIPEAVSEIREKVINATIEMLTHSNTKIAALAAKFLENALRYPMGILNNRISQDTRDAWTIEFVQTLEKLEQKIKIETIDPIVLNEIIRSVSWHAHHAGQKTEVVANRIVATAPESIDFLTTVTLIDGYGWNNRNKDYKKHQVNWDLHLKTLTNNLLTHYSDPKKLRSFLAKTILNIKTNYDGNISPNILYSRLISASVDLANETILDAIQNPASETVEFAGASLSKLLNEDSKKGFEVVQNFLSSNRRELLVAIGVAYSSVNLKIYKCDERDWIVLKDVLRSKDEWILRNAIHAVRNVIGENPSVGIELLKCVDLSISSHIADDVFMLFQKEEMIPFRILEEDDVQHFLNSLVQIPQLDGHWIETFLSELSESNPYQVTEFFLTRVEFAVKENDWKFRPCNHGPYINVPLRFRKSSEIQSILRIVWEWLKSNASSAEVNFQYRSGELFEAMFKPFDAELVSYIQGWLDISTPSDIKLISDILNEVPATFVFEHSAFVIQFLEQAQRYGKDIAERASSVFYRSSLSGMKHGTPGEPFPEDVAMKDKAEEILKILPRFSPAFKLYEEIFKHAAHDIEIAKRESEIYDE